MVVHSSFRGADRVSCKPHSTQCRDLAFIGVRGPLLDELAWMSDRGLCRFPLRNFLPHPRKRSFLLCSPHKPNDAASTFRAARAIARALPSTPTTHLTSASPAVTPSTSPSPVAAPSQCLRQPIWHPVAPDRQHGHAESWRLRWQPVLWLHK